MGTRHDDDVIEWLLAGDPAIRWQVMRDLLDEPAETWEAERRRAAESGWIAEPSSERARRRVAARALDGLDLDAAAARGVRDSRGSPGWASAC